VEIIKTPFFKIFNRHILLSLSILEIVWDLQRKCLAFRWPCIVI